MKSFMKPGTVRHISFKTKSNTEHIVHLHKYGLVKKKTLKTTEGDPRITLNRGLWKQETIFPRNSRIGQWGSRDKTMALIT